MGGSVTDWGSVDGLPVRSSALQVQKWLPTIAIRRAKRTISDISATSLSSELDSNHNGHRHTFVNADKRCSSGSRGLETWHSASRAASVNMARPDHTWTA